MASVRFTARAGMLPVILRALEAIQDAPDRRRPQAPSTYTGRFATEETQLRAAGVEGVRIA